MARPKKLSTEAMLKIVNDFYESCGDADVLKFSHLESYASSRGFDVKAYDFKRDTGVRERLAELRDLSVLTSDDGAIAYKNLDVDALIKRSKNLTTLKIELTELDETWRKIYDRALILSQKNKALVHDNQQKTHMYEELECERQKQAEHISQLANDNKNLAQANTYLKKMIRAYLYPAIANEILMNENVLEQCDTEVMPETMAALVDAELPSPLSKTITNDLAFVSREESLLRRMKSQIGGGNNDA